MLTIPMIGWVAKLGPNRASSPASRSPSTAPQTGNDWQWFPDAGNGVLTNGQNITGNDPNDANVPPNSLFQQGWVQHLVATLGHATRTAACATTSSTTSRASGTRTHRDVHPTGATMDEIRNKILDYAGMIKAVDPRRWSSGRRSGAGAATSSAATTSSTAAPTAGASFPTARNHGGMDYLPWLLDQLRQHDATTGQRLLDFFTRPLLSARRRVQRRRIQRDATAPQPLDPLAVGSRTTSTRPGSTTASSSFRA